VKPKTWNYINGHFSCSPLQVLDLHVPWKETFGGSWNYPCDLPEVAGRSRLWGFRMIQKFEDAMHGLLIGALLLIECLCIGPIGAQTPDSVGTTARAHESLEIPVGTVLPVRLNHGFSSKSVRDGQEITGRIMQDVPLPSHGKIPEGARVLGTIVSVVKAGTASPSRISFRFDNLEIHHRRIPVVTSLRAIAGFMEVQFAQTPETSLGFGTPYAWATTRQIGGDEVYGVGGPVTDQLSNHVGTAVFGGVLVHVRSQPGSNCRGPMDKEDRLQALWVFSSDACGVYGMMGVTIAHAGRTEPVGEIVLAAGQGDVLVRGASAVLLRVAR
jgi:hypothetical protein